MPNKNTLNKKDIILGKMQENTPNYLLNVETAVCIE